MRGQDSGKKWTQDCVRITPADAGTSTTPILSDVTRQDHPRGCGDKTSSGSLRVPDDGSPPRMRGQVGEGMAEGVILWITPADAGTSGICGLSAPWWPGTSYSQVMAMVTAPDHPRGCGDKRSLWFISSMVAGSPPRMRGQAWLTIRVRTKNRITPADAGTSLPVNAQDVAERDHPRGCGDKRILNASQKIQTGSPPRMRGQGWCLSVC